MTGKIEDYILDKLKGSKLHFTLFDPASIDIDELMKIVSMAEEAGTDAFMVGGSTNAAGPYLDKFVGAMKSATKLPVILFPGGSTAITHEADAILFMSILNSRNPYFITKSQALGSFTVKMANIEPIPMAYLIVEPGMTVGYIGEADPLPRKKPSIAAAYALAGQYLGMRLVYLEAGSGANEPVPPKMVMTVKHAIDVPLIVGGGIRTPEQAKEAIKAGADIIVTGNIVEEDPDRLSAIIRSIKE